MKLLLYKNILLHENTKSLWSALSVYNNIWWLILAIFSPPSTIILHVNSPLILIFKAQLLLTSQSQSPATFSPIISWIIDQAV